MNAYRLTAQSLLLCLPLLLVAGCPQELLPVDGQDLLPGKVWVEQQDGVLAAYVLPAYRGEDGQWLTIDTAAPAWYTGPALYEYGTDGTWKRVSGADETLDDVLQTYDAPPKPEL